MACVLTHLHWELAAATACTSSHRGKKENTRILKIVWLECVGYKPEFRSLLYIRSECSIVFVSHFQSTLLGVGSATIRNRLLSWSKSSGPHSSNPDMEVGTLPWQLVVSEDSHEIFPKLLKLLLYFGSKWTTRKTSFSGIPTSLVHLELGRWA